VINQHPVSIAEPCHSPPLKDLFDRKMKQNYFREMLFSLINDTN
jgi:hypothetical protein